MLVVWLYAKEDEDEAKKLLAQTIVLESELNVQSFHRGTIRPGEDKRTALHAALRRADIVMLLLSRSGVVLWVSKLEKEVQETLRPGVAIVPVLLSSCVLPADIERCESLPGSDEFILKMKDPEEGRTRVVKGLRELLRTTRVARNTPPSSPTQNLILDETLLLHLSSVHIRSKAEGHELLGNLVADLHNLGCELLTAVVVSGDAGLGAGPPHCDHSLAFLEALREAFHVHRDRLMIVPGDRDVALEATPPLGATQHPLARFASLHQEISHDAYPLEHGEQVRRILLPEDGIALVGLSSVWELTLDSPDRVSLHAGATDLAVQWLRDLPEHFLRVAIWHHPLAAPGRPGVSDSIIRRFAEARVSLVLHGHVAAADNDALSCGRDFSGRPVHFIGAGIAGARHSDEEPAPLGYNLLRVRPNWIVVDTRRRDTDSSAFRGDLRWPWTEADGRTVALRDRYSLRR